MCSSGVIVALQHRGGNLLCTCSPTLGLLPVTETSARHSIHYFLLLSGHKGASDGYKHNLASSPSQRPSSHSSCGLSRSRAELSRARPSRAELSRAKPSCCTFDGARVISEKAHQVRSALKKDAKCGVMCFWSHNSRSVSRWRGFGFDILTHWCRPFGWRVGRASSGRVGREPAAPPAELAAWRALGWSQSSKSNPQFVIVLLSQTQKKKRGRQTG